MSGITQFPLHIYYYYYYYLIANERHSIEPGIGPGRESY